MSTCTSGARSAASRMRGTHSPSSSRLVQVAEPLDDGDAAPLPCLGSAPVEAHDGQPRRAHERDRWNRGLRARRRIDHDEGDGVLGEEAHRALAVLVVEPRRVAQLDANGGAASRWLRGGSPRGLAVGKNQRGYWRKTHRASRTSGAARGASRKRAQISSSSASAAGPGRRCVAARAALPAALAEILRQALHLRWLTGHQGVSLDVEREVGRRALQPQLGRPPRRQRVVRGIDLHDRELVRVVDEALLGGVRRRAGRRRRPRSSSGRSRTRYRCGWWHLRCGSAREPLRHAPRRGQRPPPARGRAGSRPTWTSV
jgi:hypothetical protein